MNPKVCWMFFALLVLGPACEPAQWLITVSTDAHVPQMGDRLLLAVFNENNELACKECRREFGAGDPKLWPLSFGVALDVAPPDAELHAYAVLFRSDHLDGSAVRGNLYLDRMTRLPALRQEYRKTEVSLTLPMGCLGLHTGKTDEGYITCDPQSGQLVAEPQADTSPPPALTTGSWDPGRDVPCDGALPSAAKVPADMVCIDGGAFVMGGVRYPDAATAAGGLFTASEPEALVAVSPFAIDRDEFTVREYAALRQRYPGLSRPFIKGQPEDLDRLCNATGTPQDETNDQSLNCVSHQLASQLCELQGKRLPTEAEWEFAAGNRTLETQYPWGFSDDICSHAVVGRAPGVFDVPKGRTSAATECRGTGDGQVLDFGPQPGGHPADVTLLGVRNLGGNMAEWVADSMIAYDRPCWGRLPLWRNFLDNPLCQPGYASAAAVRGGQWNMRSSQSLAVVRTYGDYQIPLVQMGQPDSIPMKYYGIGFRCAKDMRSVE